MYVFGVYILYSLYVSNFSFLINQMHIRHHPFWFPPTRINLYFSELKLEIEPHSINIWFCYSINYILYWIRIEFELFKLVATTTTTTTTKIEFVYIPDRAAGADIDSHCMVAERYILATHVHAVRRESHSRLVQRTQIHITKCPRLLHIFWFSDFLIYDYWFFGWFDLICFLSGFSI